MDEPKIFIVADVEIGENYLEMPIRDFSVTEFYKIVQEKNEIIGVYFDVKSHLVSFIVKEKTGG